MLLESVYRIYSFERYDSLGLGRQIKALHCHAVVICHKWPDLDENYIEQEIE